MHRIFIFASTYLICSDSVILCSVLSLIHSMRPLLLQYRAQLPPSETRTSNENDIWIINGMRLSLHIVAYIIVKRWNRVNKTLYYRFGLQLMSVSIVRNRSCKLLIRFTGNIVRFNWMTFDQNWPFCFHPHLFPNNVENTIKANILHQFERNNKCFVTNFRMKFTEWKPIHHE